MSDVDGRARAMLASFRAATSPTRATEEHALAAVESRIVAGDVEDSEVAPPPSSVAYHLRSAALAVAIAAAVLLAVRAVSFGVSSLSVAEPPSHDAASDVPAPERVPSTIEPAPSVIAPVPVAPPSTVAPPVPVQSPTPVLAPSERRSAAAAVPRSSDDLVAEVALVRAAKAERDDAAALELLEKHAREFPNGSLARERSVLRAERLCALGRSDDARALASRFVAAHANDPLVPRMAEVCRAK